MTDRSSSEDKGGKFGLAALIPLIIVSAVVVMGLVWILAVR